jgi:hypothetical protein
VHNDGKGVKRQKEVDDERTAKPKNEMNKSGMKEKKNRWFRERKSSDSD